MSTNKRLFFWLLAFIAFILFLSVFQSILLPFVAGMALAYLLDPIADYLETHGFGRIWATVTILLIFLIVFTAALLILLPILGKQLIAFLDYLPELAGNLENLLRESLGPQMDRLANLSGQTNKIDWGAFVGQAANFVGGLLSSIWSGGQALISIIGLAVVTPVVAFYLLLDWDNMIERIDSWLPRDYQQTIRALASDMDSVVAGFVRGQVMMCLILGTFYAVALLLVGLKFGLLIGLTAGLISFIPYVGAIVGFGLSIGVALVQFWPDYFMIGAVLGVFVVGQFLEGNVLQPKLLGGSVGLHPVWLMFALFAFGSLMGFVGMLIAIPAAAVVGVLARFALRQYLASSLYAGHYKNTNKTEGLE
ncbi:AI-2 transport protein TqsA [Pseudovibrio sp. Ad13]|uniref:AI-2E family transporter n=1 Tax=unclassified Pseudovibrio TaxID=2627060 RepID=UPI00070E8F0B|nr:MULTISPECIES: AI-2E family transporter [unclassified Pseudovibrio]KZK82709.1 AI-2 transport protein TqsA [Pseudovibrio sp. Ad13]KZK85479.1 AI-2 transport protein TqsA [Pseudovibrio sp. Ad46]KZK97648.1 AI-2 transport protein TqsA [Pseudovibrio sp. Ad5]KZL26632.1 AI-2 transport protein TqsA [Pseudovibrio sp. WM33]